MYCRYFIYSRLVLSFILSLLLAIFPAPPAHAVNEVITLSPQEGEIGDSVDIDGSGFEANKVCHVYFSSDKAAVNRNIDTQVTAYKRVIIIRTDADGKFADAFTVPSKLTDGAHKEDVHGGDYYVYVTYRRSTTIRAIAKFTVIGGEIEVNPEEGQVGSEVEISGKRFGINQKITIEYDDDAVDIANGDKETRSNGEFTCTIVIPESTAGAHTVTVTDESGNEPEAEFSVKPKITIGPTSGAAGDEVKISGSGFNFNEEEYEQEYITITVGGRKALTTPAPIYTRPNGSFTASFLVTNHAISGTIKIEAGDSSRNRAEAEFTILPGISLNPPTNQTSPGHVGMEVTVYGSKFIANATVTVTYDKSLPVGSATADTYGNFSATFTVPPSLAGDHAVTATDGTNTLTSTFTMESEAPPVPVPLLPEFVTSAEPEAYFDWRDVADPSGITYTLQIGTDVQLSTIVLEKKGLTDSEYTITKEEKLESTGLYGSYHWRVRAIDSASNESKWTSPVLFYVGLSQKSILSLTPYVYILIGLGVLLLGILGLWALRRNKGYPKY